MLQRIHIESLGHDFVLDPFENEIYKQGILDGKADLNTNTQDLTVGKSDVSIQYTIIKEG